jgi:chromosome segregation ATPase
VDAAIAERPREIPPPTAIQTATYKKLLSLVVINHVSIGDVLTAMLGQAPLVAAAVAALYVLFSREIGRVEMRIGRLEGQIGELGGRLDRLEERVGRLEDRVGNLENQVGKLESRMGALEDRMGRLEGQVGNIGKQVDSLREQMGKLESRMGALEDRMGRLEDRVGKLEGQIGDLGGRMDKIEEQLAGLGRSFQIYNSTLPKVLSTKGVLTGVEAEALAGYLSLVPPARSKYYTEEVRQRLIELIKAVREGRYTAADVRELGRIAELMEKEWEETGRRDLLDYYLKLQMLVAILEGILVSRGEWPREELWA